MASAHSRLAEPRGWREWISSRLLRLGGRLIRWAWLLAPTAARSEAGTDLHLEFGPLGGGSSDHGGLYVNGQLVGTLAGVRRL
ncbi:hypothetical protein CDN98_22100 [Roseateles terrae]|nr:hypothetical protein CDN98_22100 [Roseateles terrae]